MAGNVDIRRNLRTNFMILSAVILVLSALFLLDAPVSKYDEIPYEVLVQRLFDNVIEKVEEMRGLKRPENTKLNIVSIQWFKDQEQEKVEGASEEIGLEDIVYKALFLIPDDYSVGEARVEQAGQILSAVAGSNLYIVKEYFDPLDTYAAQRTLAHEITHLLQSKFQPSDVSTFDQMQAWIALLEGDADFTSDTYVSKSGLFSYRASVPESLDRIKGFPYRYGSLFVSALYDEGGWSLVNSAYSNIPKSTEEVLHPNIYLAGGSFNNVAALTPLNGWVEVWAETLGEHFILVMLENGISIDEASIAATGWGGDNLTLLKQGDNYLVTWRINWDTEKDASEFYNAYISMIRQMSGVEVESELFNLKGHYVAFVKHGKVTDIAISKDKEVVISVKSLMKP